MTTADILIHVHPELSAETRAKLEKEVSANNGVISAHFDHHKHPHALIVLYNSDAIQSKKILEAVKRHDSAASMVGL
jgi:hypothetical protein